jgi:glucuronate isomerase
MKKFMTEDFLLQTETAKRLYHDYAAKMPIFDYHCHLPPADVAENRQFKNLTHVWLYGDHYKWRAMRTNGVEERYITGDASDFDKFMAWAKTVPYTIRNPLYHWTHMELQKPFGIKDKILNPDTAGEIYNECNDLLKTEAYRARGIMQQMNVKVVCTTDDPTDSLAYHQQILTEGTFPVKVLPAFRPDKAMAVESPSQFNAWITKLEAVTKQNIYDYDSFLDALKKRHTFFHEMGCRLSDHGIEQPYAEDYTTGEIKQIFQKVCANQSLTQPEILKFKSAMMYEFGLMNHARDWTTQLHFGALRNNNSRYMRVLGPDTGFDTIGDFEIARPLAKFLDRLDTGDKLAKTIIYVLNPRDNELIATMLGCFQGGSIPGKIQFGSAWWFNDQKDGMERQMNALSVLGLLSRFVGMLTDSRSFLSYPRHEYFRRILCNMLGNDVENGELPHDLNHLGKIVQDISFNNAAHYFGIKVD